MSSFREALAGPSFPQALCKGDPNPDRFYLDSEAELEKVARELKAICFKCPHSTDCLAFAMSKGDLHGFWGGTLPRERRKLLRMRGEGKGKGQTRTERRSKIEVVVRYRKQGLTQKEVGELLGMSDRNVSKIEELARQRKVL